MSSTRIAARLHDVAPSATLALAERAKQLKDQGLDVVSLTAGEPDFPPAPHVIAAATSAMERGQTKYTAVAGIAELRDAIRASIAKDDGIDYRRDQIVVGAGAKQAIYNALMALVEPDDEVLIVAPYWLSYRDMVLLAGGRPIILQTDQERGFRLEPAALAAAINDRTRLLILNSPSNPAGASYEADDLKAFAEILRRQPAVLVLSDDIYRRIYFRGPKAPSLLSIAPDLVPRTIVIDGCSKTFAMTGLRIGWAAAPPEIAEAMLRVQAQSTSCAASPSQYAALAALTGDQAWVDAMVSRFDARRMKVMSRLAAIPGMSCVDPAGAFYVFPSCDGLIGKHRPNGARLENSDDFAQYLLDDHGLIGVPGAPFGSDRHIRFSFATDEATIDRGMSKLAEAVAALK